MVGWETGVVAVVGGCHSERVEGSSGRFGRGDDGVWEVGLSEDGSWWRAGAAGGCAGGHGGLLDCDGAVGADGSGADAAFAVAENVALGDKC